MGMPIDDVDGVNKLCVAGSRAQLACQAAKRQVRYAVHGSQDAAPIDGNFTNSEVRFYRYWLRHWSKSYHKTRVDQNRRNTPFDRYGYIVILKRGWFVGREN